MPSLSSKFDKEGKKGLVVIGVTDESVSKVDAWYARLEPTYPIVILKDKEFENALGVRGFPTVGVIAPDGKLTFAGFGGESAIKEAMSDAKKAPLWPSKLSKAQSKLGEGDLSAAWAEVVKLQDKAGKDEELDRWTNRFADAIAGQAVDAFERAKASADSGLVYRAVELVEPLVEAKTPLPVSEQAGEWLRALRAEDGYDDELKAGALHAKALEEEQDGDYAAACKQYVKAAEKYPDTQLAAAARGRAASLVAQGLPGYKSSCGSCKREKQACSKHAVTIKL